MHYESSDYAEYFGVEQNKNELKHHGIKGQRWGKRNGPPYPLDPEDHSAAEKKASNKSWGSKKSEGKPTNDDKKSEGKSTNDDRANYDDLDSRLRRFDSLSTDDKFKMVDELEKEQTKELRENGTSARFETLNKKFHELRYKAGESKCRDIDNMKDGPEKDKQWEQLLADSMEYGQDSEYLPYLIDKMQKTSGDYLSGQYKTEGSRQAGEALNKLDAEYRGLSNEKRKLESKMFKSSKDKNRISEINEFQSSFDSKYESAFNKYCEEVLKDMGMPVNENTISYISSVIIWN